MEQITTIGIDIAKSVFQVHGVSESGEVLLRRRLRRSELVSFAAACPTVRDVTHEAVQRWVDNLDVAPATVQRSLSGIRSYWKYLQRSDVKAVPKDVQPFVGLDLPKRRNGNGKRDQRRPFEPPQVMGLCAAAGREGDSQLVNLILICSR